MRRALRIVGAVLGVAAGLLLAGGATLAVVVLSRSPPQPLRSTAHASIERRGCISCHAPIAEEWRASYHFRSVTGPYWDDVRRLGYARFFGLLRKRCLDCHAPANVLDLPAGPASPAAGGALGVECTPNALREPEGIIPTLRSDDVELGVDCVACHVSRNGVTGSGRRSTAAHETIADRRFQDPAHASETLCGTCHRSTAEAWRGTKLAREGVTCLDCHMPRVNAPSVAGGPERERRSHGFPADKDDVMLRRGINASLRTTGDGKAIFRIVNDRVGHHLPSGGNFISVRLEARDGGGRVVREEVLVYGKDEALLLDFWPFDRDERIPPGEEREVVFALPEGHGVVEAVVRYHDWMRTRRTVLTLKESY